jgi:hypothetical protein
LDKLPEEKKSILAFGGFNKIVSIKGTILFLNKYNIKKGLKQLFY